MSSDPISTVLELVPKIIHRVEQVQHHKELQKWQNELGREINHLLFSAEKILDAVGQLGITIQDDLRATFASEYIARLRGEMLNLEAIMASVYDFESIPAETKARLTAAVERIRTIIYSGQNYGSAAVAPTLTAISVVDAVMRMADLTESEIAHTKAQFRSLLVAPLLNTEIPDSLVSIERTLETEYGAITERLQRKLGHVTLGTDPSRFVMLNMLLIGAPKKSGSITRFTTILSGDIDVPESIASSPVESKALEAKSIGIFGLLTATWVFDLGFFHSGMTAASLEACDALRAELVAQAKSLAVERQLLREKLLRVGELVRLARDV